MNNKKIVYLIIFALICLVAIGYAALVSNITITGTAAIKSSTFDVHFENVSVTSGSVAINTTAGDSAATIEPTNRTRVDYSVTLEKPGDFYEFTVKVVNGGGMDAMINTVTSKMNNVVINNNLPNYLEYNVTYDDDIAIANNHMLNSGDVETYKVRVAYRTDINPSDLPTTPSTLNFSFSVNYIQKDSNATTRPTAFRYTTSETAQYIGSSFNITGSPNPETAMSTFGHDFFLRHKIEKNVISQSYVGFRVGGTIYYLRGGAGDEGKSGSRPIYTANMNELYKAFGASNCNETTTNANYDCYKCSNASLSADACTYGTVNVRGDGFRCIIYGDGTSFCNVF